MYSDTNNAESHLKNINQKLGDPAEIAPTTDTARSGINGRLQRIAQRLTTLVAGIPAALGQATMANSMPVVIASNQSNIPIIGNDTDNAAITTNKPVLTGGQAVDNTSYSPAYTTSDAVTNNYDKDTGALIVSGITPSAYRLQGLINTAVAVKASSGSLMGWNIRNNTSSSVYVKFCNTAQGSTTPGSTAVVFSLQVPANGSVFQENTGCSQHYFSTAITAYACTGFLDNDATSPGANVVTVELKYK